MLSSSAAALMLALPAMAQDPTSADNGGAIAGGDAVTGSFNGNSYTDSSTYTSNDGFGQT